MIKNDSSIQDLLTGYFSNSAVKDIVVVGHNSIRLIVVRNNKLCELSRYNHENAISSACICENGEDNNIVFISNQYAFFLYFENQGLHLKDQSLYVKDFLFVSSEGKMTVFYDVRPMIALVNDNGVLNELGLSSRSVYSCTIYDKKIIILELINTFECSIYRISNESGLCCVNRYKIAYDCPYRLVNLTKYVVVLCESCFYRLNINDNNSELRKYELDIKDRDNLIISSACFPSSLFFLTATGTLISYDFQNITVSINIPNAHCIIQFSLNKLIIASECGRLELYDRDLHLVDELNNVICKYVTNINESLMYVSFNSIFSLSNDYGIKPLKIADLDNQTTPDLITSKDNIYLLYRNSIIILDENLKETTPSLLKRKHSERIHVISHHIFFLLEKRSISVFDHGSICSIPFESSLSCNYDISLFVAEKQTISLFIYSYSSIGRQGNKSFSSQISSMCAISPTSLIIAFFNGDIIIVDDEFETIHSLNVNCFCSGLLFSNNSVFVALTNEEINVYSKDLVFLNTITKPLGVTYLYGESSHLVIKCDGSLYVFEKNEIHKMPTDMMSLCYLSDNKYVALSKNNKQTSVFTFFLDESEPLFRTRLLYEFNSNINSFSAIKDDNFVGYFGRQSTLFWSRGEAKYTIESNEIVHAIIDWKALHNSKQVSFWVVVTETTKKAGRLLLFTQSRSDYKIVLILSKTFATPITDIVEMSTRLAIISHSDSIHGISLETGALTRKFTYKSPIDGIHQMSAKENKLAILTKYNGFFLLSIVNDTVTELFSIKKPFLGGRILVSTDMVIVSDRTSSLLFFSLNGVFLKKYSYLSPISEIIPYKNGFIYCTVCGEIWTDQETLDFGSTCKSIVNYSLQ